MVFSSCGVANTSGTIDLSLLLNHREPIALTRSPLLTLLLFSVLIVFFLFNLVQHRSLFPSFLFPSHTLLTPKPPSYPFPFEWSLLLCFGSLCYVPSIHVLDVRCVRCVRCMLDVGLYLYVLGVCVMSLLYVCVRCKTLCIIGGQHDGLCLFWQPARGIFTVLLCCVFFSSK